MEGKVNESFGEYVCDWNDGSQGKKERLSFLCDELGLTTSSNVQKIRYQLLHRTVSAILEAKKFNASNALMLVHAFKDENYNPKQFDDYKEFAELYDIEVQLNKIHLAKKFGKKVSLYLGWVEGNKKYLQR